MGDTKTLGDSMASKGGKAAAASMTPEQRRERARRAAEARWQADDKSERVATVICGDPGRPLRIGDVTLPCYVLDDERRVLSMSGMVAALGMKKGNGEGGEGGNRLARFATGKALKPYIPEGVRAALINPIQFRRPKGRGAYGFEATLLADLCLAVIRARLDGVLMPHQAHIATQCEILMLAFAKTGIVALVDEATGYQYARDADALRLILERYISKELAKWVQTFEPQFYEQMYRLRGWDRDHRSSRKPSCVAKYTINLVYDRIHPDLLGELKLTRADWERQGGKKGGKLHQFLTANEGHPRLKQHLEGVTMVMRFSKSWDEMMERMDEAYPMLNHTLRIPFPEPAGEDD